MQSCDILVVGTGYFAEVMICDLAATARKPLRLMVGGRNRDRLAWLSNAGNARAAVFGTGVTVGHVELDTSSADTLVPSFAELKPKVVVQSASIQSPWSVDRLDSAWSKLVAEAGFGITIAFHALLASRSAKAVEKAAPDAFFVNTCYPDGVNQVLKAAGLPISTGVGNVSIFSSMMGGRLPFTERPKLRVIGHHQHLVQWRKPPGTRLGPPVRAWLGEQEIDTDELTKDIQLPYRDLNIVSGAGAVPVLRALAGEGAIVAHVPGPGGLPGGYPVIVNAAGVTVDLPKAITLDEAVAWNRSFEPADGVSVSGGNVVYSEQAANELSKYSRALAGGFAASDIEMAAKELSALRTSMGG